MASPTRANQMVDTLPSLYFQDPVLRRAVDAVAGELSAVQADLEAILHAHWVDTADAEATPTVVERPNDLGAIAGLVPLAPFRDEEAARRTPETVLVNATTVLEGPPGDLLTFERLVAGQQVFVAGSRRSDGAVVAARLAVGRPSVGAFELRLSGPIAGITPPSAVDPVGRLVVLGGRTGAEMFRQRLKLTTEVFLNGVGTAPAVLQMVAATMGWGRLIGAFSNWSADWAPTRPVFAALAEGAAAPIRLRELPLRTATTPFVQRVKSGARWIETGGSAFVAAPTIQLSALDLPVLMPTVVSLDTQVAISTLIVLETLRLEQNALVRQDVSLSIEGQPNGTLRGTLFVTRLPEGGTTRTDVSERIRVRSPGLRVDRPGAAAFLSGGADDRVATLVVSDGRRALRLTARSDGIWGNAIRVGHANPTTLELRYDPPLAVGAAPSPDSGVYVETASLDSLLDGQSRLVTAEDFTFRIPEGQSHWLYFDHAAPAMFDLTQWDITAFDAPAASGDLDAAFADFPAKAAYDYAAFERGVFPQEFLRAFRFDQPTSRFDEAAYNETPEQVDVLLGWQEGQRSTIRVDVPVASEAERARLARVPEMIRQVKPAGVRVILGQPLLETQPLGELRPRRV